MTLATSFPASPASNIVQPAGLQDMPAWEPPKLTKEARQAPDSKEMLEYVRFINEIERHFRESSQTIWTKTNDWWELFLAQQVDTRDPVDEMWRSDVFVPLPFSVSRTKSAQITELLGNVEPVWQVEATQEKGAWYEQSKHYERTLEYVHRGNMWRKFLYKLALARSVQGTAFFKVVWTKRAHKVTLFSTQEEHARFTVAVQQAVQQGAPQPPSWRNEPEAFDRWRELVNMSGTKGNIPAPPVNGPREVVEYEGPLFQYLPLWTVRWDPMIDEMRDQKVIIHRMVKPLSYVLNKADNDPNSSKPYYLENVEKALGGVGESLLESEEEELAQAMGLNPNKESHPYFEKPVVLYEVWSPELPFQYTIIMNKEQVINKRPFEGPLLTSHPNIFALRNIIVPGHAYGLSDYQESEKLFTELNSFRRVRMDGATLNTLPVFVKEQGVNLTEALKKIRPGMIITLPRKDAIQSLIKHTLPPEAYREPPEMKAEIEDATEVYGPQKGQPAQVGRVTGTEFQGRAASVLLKYKVDASIVEEEMQGLPGVIFSLFAQMGPSQLRRNIGGDPDAIIDVTREQLIEAIGIRYRFRGATKNIQPDLQVQQITQAVKQFGADLTPIERRFALQIILELLDVRGYSKILSVEGGQQIQTQAQLQQGAMMSGLGLQKGQTDAAQVPVPGAIPPGDAAAISGNEGG